MRMPTACARHMIGVVSALMVLGVPTSAQTPAQPPAASAANQTLTVIDGLRVGHMTLTARPTGCTVVIVDRTAVGAVDVRGGAPGTRETDLLAPFNTVQDVNAIVLAGGSAFGLDAAGGVMRFLSERRIGYSTSAGPVPIV